MTTRSKLARRMWEGALWLGAILGTMCLVLGVLALVLDVRPLVFKSGSMSPEIEAGALALAREVPASELAVGDVVSVESGRNVRITHRIVSIENTDSGAILQLKGDANAAPDSESYQVDDAYRVFVDVPLAGHVVNAASTPWGLLLCGGFVTLLLVSAFGRDRHRDDDGAHEEGRDSTGAGRGTGGAPRASGGGHRATRKAVVATSATMLVAGGVAMAPFGTMATFTDTSVVTSGALTAHTITPPGAASEPCTSGLFTFLNVHWIHSDAANIEYRVVVTSVETGAVAVDYGWRAPTGPVGQNMAQEIRATGNPSVGRNGEYLANIYARTQVGKEVGWTSLPPRQIAIQRVLGLMYCGH